MGVDLDINMSGHTVCGASTLRNHNQVLSLLRTDPELLLNCSI